MIHTTDLRRAMPAALRVTNVGYLPSRTRWIRRKFQTVDFSFILSGSGRLRYGKRWYPVESPCVIMQWPGSIQEFGPEPEGASWEQLFMVFDQSLVPMFIAWGILPTRQPVWPIASPQTVRNLANELVGCMHNAKAPGMADRIDRICERMLLESRQAQPRVPDTPFGADLDHIRRYISMHLDQQYDSGLLARDYGMAEVTFRRHWAERFKMPFKRDIMNLRMQEASRMLTGTDMEVKDIASALGFGDPLYFSRRFAGWTGLPPSEYRHQFSDIGGDAHPR